MLHFSFSCPWYLHHCTAQKQVLGQLSLPLTQASLVQTKLLYDWLGTAITILIIYCEAQARIGKGGPSRRKASKLVYHLFWCVKLLSNLQFQFQFIAWWLYQAQRVAPWLEVGGPHPSSQQCDLTSSAEAEAGITWQHPALLLFYLHLHFSTDTQLLLSVYIKLLPHCHVNRNQACSRTKFKFNTYNVQWMNICISARRSHTAF